MLAGILLLASLYIYMKNEGSEHVSSRILDHKLSVQMDPDLLGPQPWVQLGIQLGIQLGVPPEVQIN